MIEDRLAISPAGYKMLIGNDLEQYRCDTALTKEAETADWIHHYIVDGECLIDIGANIGIYSLMAARQHPNSLIYAFEPVLSNFFRLYRNANLNSYTNIRAVYAGLSDVDDILPVNIRDERIGGSGSQIDLRHDELGVEFTPAAMAHVCVYRLDSFIEFFGLQDPDHIKIDVDGLEAKIVYGLDGLLNRDRLKSVMIEINNYGSSSSLIYERFKRAGFETDNPINRHPEHSRQRRSVTGNKHAENVLFTR